MAIYSVTQMKPQKEILKTGYFLSILQMGKHSKKKVLAWNHRNVPSDRQSQDCDPGLSATTWFLFLISSDSHCMYRQEEAKEQEVNKSRTNRQKEWQ